MARRPSLILLAGIFLSLPLAAEAQINPFRGTRAGLTSEDFRIMERTARQLAAEGNVADGASKEWSNPRTGASGSVTVAGTFHNRGMICRKVDYTATTQGRQSPSTTTVNWCKTARGWKMM